MCATRDVRTVTFVRPPAPDLDLIQPGLGIGYANQTITFVPTIRNCLGSAQGLEDGDPAGIGVFYENAIWNNAEFDRPERLATGAFLANPVACFNGSASGVPFPAPGTTGTLEFLGGNQTAAGVVRCAHRSDTGRYRGNLRRNDRSTVYRHVPDYVSSCF